MESHVVCYVRRKVITDWKRLVIAHAEPAFVYGSNDDRVFGKSLKSGGVLWVVASIPGQPPELAARLKVRRVVSSKDTASLAELGVGSRLLRHFRRFRWIAVGDDTSEFFGHNSVGQALILTPFIRKSGPEFLDSNASQWAGYLGSKLHRPALVYTEDETGIAHLEKLAGTAHHSVFLSWKWTDNPQTDIRKFAYYLAQEGLMVWLDQLALPASKALEKVVEDSETLRHLLTYGYRKCCTVLAVESENYGVQTDGSDRNWTLDEWTAVLNRKNPPGTVVYGQNPKTFCQVTSHCDHRLISSDPKSAAKELSAYIKSAITQA